MSSPSPPEPPLQAEHHGTTLALFGDLTQVAQVEALWCWIPGTSASPGASGPVPPQPPPIRRVELGEVDIDSGPALADLVTWIRALAKVGPIVLVEAPQMLAHTLYKVGDLRSSGVRLERPRMDQGTTAN